MEKKHEAVAKVPAAAVCGGGYSTSINPLIQHVKENFNSYSTVAIKAFLNRNCNKFAVALTKDEVIVVYNHNIYITNAAPDKGVAGSVRESIDDLTLLFKAAPVLFGNCVGADNCTVVCNGMIDVSAYNAGDMELVVNAYNRVRGIEERGDDDEWY